MTEQANLVNGNNAQPTLSFTFTVQEWSILRAGLYELPAKLSVPIIGKLEAFLMQAQNAMQATDEIKAQGSVIQ